MSTFRASLIIGVLWGTWHIPFFIFDSAGSVVECSRHMAYAVAAFPVHPVQAQFFTAADTAGIVSTGRGVAVRDGVARSVGPRQDWRPKIMRPALDCSTLVTTIWTSWPCRCLHCSQTTIVPSSR